MIEYAYVNTRVSILAGRLFSDKQLTELLNQPLGNIALTNYDDNEWENIDSANLERVWLIKMLLDFKILTRPLSGINYDLLMYWFRKHDIANIKTIVRGKISKLETKTISEQLLDLKPLTILPIEKLLRTEDVNELLRELENSHYSPIARQVRRVYEKEHQLYSLDAAIDRHYLLGLVQKVRTLDNTQYYYLLPLISIFIDRLNLLWLLRYRFVYNLSAAETYYLLVPTPYRLNRAVLQKLAELNSLPEVLENLPEPLLGLLKDTDTIFAVDQRLMQEVKRVAYVTLKLRNFTLAKIFAYVLLREMEMRQIIAIVKGKRLNLKPQHILSAIEASASFMV